MEIIKRELVMENGQRVFLQAGPRYPFWTISFERGSVPSVLSGMYSDYDKAVYDIEKYMKTRPKNKQGFKEAAKESA